MCYQHLWMLLLRTAFLDCAEWSRELLIQVLVSQCDGVSGNPSTVSAVAEPICCAEMTLCPEVLGAANFQQAGEDRGTRPTCWCSARFHLQSDSSHV